MSMTPTELDVMSRAPVAYGRDPMPDPIAAINRIRRDSDLKSFERKRQVASVVLTALETTGRLLRTTDNALYYFDEITKTVQPIDGDDFRAELYDHFDLNGTEEETHFVEDHLRTVVRCRGQRVQVHRLACWDRNKKKLYMNAHTGRMFVLDGCSIELADNGYDGVLFLADRRAAPIEVDPEVDTPAPAEPFHRLFEGLNVAGGPQHRAQAVALLKIWTVTLFFPQELPVRPLLMLKGAQGAGKTTVARRIGRVLYGTSFEVGSFRTDAIGEQDFLAAVTARPLVVFDNADARIPWLPDHLAKLATGAEIERRRLYTTNTLVTFRPECFLILTTREPKWKRDDIVRRLLPIQLETITGAKRPEAELQSEIIKARQNIWRALLTILNQTVAALAKAPEGFTSFHRLADFHGLGNHVATVLGCSEEFMNAMEQLDNRQLAVLAEDDERVQLLEDWTAGRPAGWSGSRLASKDLFAELKELYGNDRTFPFKSSEAVGTWLGHNKDLLVSRLGIETERFSTGRERGWCFRPVRCQRANSTNGLKDNGSSCSDAMTPSSAKSLYEYVDEHDIQGEIVDIDVN